MRLQDLWDRGGQLLGALDDRGWAALAELPPPDAVHAINETADKMGDPSNGVRNPSAYFTAVCKKLAQRGGGGGGGGGAYGGGGGGGYGGGGDRGDRGGGGGSGGSRGPGLPIMAPDVRARCEDLCARHPHQLRADHFDLGVAEAFARMQPSDVDEVLTELEAAVGGGGGGVRNVPAFLMGMCRRRGGGGGGGGRGGGGGGY
jgi:hypothetical protein